MLCFKDTTFELYAKMKKLFSEINRGKENG